MKTFEEIKASKKVIVSVENEDGFSGYIEIRGWRGTIIASWGCGWDHVSVAPAKSNYTPTWDDMCAIKDLFFKDDEAVIQIHPPKSEYINLRKIAYIFGVEMMLIWSYRRVGWLALKTVRLWLMCVRKLKNTARNTDITIKVVIKCQR